MTHHVLHSLAIAKFVPLKPGAKILDLGTGGGFPGIPLAIYFPETTFILMDGTGKKIQVVRAIADALGLVNVTAIHGRAEESKIKVDFVVSRAVASIGQLAQWSMHLIKKEGMHAVPNGLFALKGGQLNSELKELPRHLISEKHPLSQYYKEAYFEEKYLIYVQ
jgi:16S rRNA (guanine527-N7)-methyltransferase